MSVCGNLSRPDTGQNNMDHGVIVKIELVASNQTDTASVC